WALRLGFPRAISARCASRTSTGLAARALIMAASSRAVFRVRLLSAIDPSLPRPVDELALDQQKQEIEAVAQPAGREDRRVHIGHGEQLLRLEHALTQAVGRADEHLGDDHDHQRQRDAIAQSDEGLRQRFEQNMTSVRTRSRDAPITLAAKSRVLRACMTP